MNWMNIGLFNYLIRNKYKLCIKKETPKKRPYVYMKYTLEIKQLTQEGDGRKQKQNHVSLLGAKPKKRPYMYMKYTLEIKQLTQEGEGKKQKQLHVSLLGAKAINKGKKRARELISVK